MALVDLISLIDDNADVVIRHPIEGVLAVYDGRDSIPTEYNLRDVLRVWAEDSRLFIEIR